MALTAIFFYLFAVLCVGSAATVIIARNPVHAVLFLILAFFNAAGLFILLGAEFLAMLLVIVYVGAVAVLFLFVVMMLDVDFAELRGGFVKNAPAGLLVAGIVVVELVSLYMFRGFSVGTGDVRAVALPTSGSGLSNIEALGRVLYTKYIYFFQGAGLILLVAMVGAIVLTLHHKVGVRRQSISEQVARRPATSVEVMQVASGSAILPSQDEQGG